MELLLWQWSVGVQWASLAMITVFFLILERSLRLPELRAWVAAWFCDLLALGITVVYWNWRPEGGAFRVVSAGYLSSKAAFGILLIAGALMLAKLGSRAWEKRTVLAVVLAIGAGGLFVTTLPMLGLVSNPLMGSLFAFGGIVLVRRSPAMRWLAVAMVLRAVLFFGVSAAFFLTDAQAGGRPSALLDLARAFQSTHSFYDTGAEWLLALGCVLTLSDRVSGELRQTNRDLLAAQEDLRRLVDRDALTGLLNRRGLPEVLRRVQPGGALLLFFDLDGFKALNDRYGHQAGDESLKRFAQGLRECFRPGDGLVRYAGDEFLVVAQGLDREGAEGRVDRLRSRLRFVGAEQPHVSFSVGISVLEPGGVPEAALEAADRSMYQAKGARSA